MVAHSHRRKVFMEQHDAVIAVFADREGAEAAVKKLAGNGFDMKQISVVGKGYHTEEKVVGFYNAGDRVKFWGTRGAFWGGLWGLFFGGLFMTIPVVGHIVVLGYLAAMAISGIESAVVVGGLSALGAALYSTGIPKDSVIEYESAVKADGYLVTAHGPAAAMARAKMLLDTANPTRLFLHQGLQPPSPAAHAADAAA
jgi:Heat induced stress protein YflT domain